MRNELVNLVIRPILLFAWIMSIIKLAKTWWLDDNPNRSFIWRGYTIYAKEREIFVAGSLGLIVAFFHTWIILATPFVINPREETITTIITFWLSVFFIKKAFDVRRKEISPQNTPEENEEE